MKSNPVIVSNKDWQDLIGIQFALGGSNPKVGLNCYGLVREVYKNLNIELPEYQETALDAQTLTNAAGRDWIKLDSPKPYSVALIRSEGLASSFHLAIVTPEITLLHALPKKGVVVSPIEKYEARIIGFYVYDKDNGEALPIAEGDVGRIIGMLAIVALSIAMPAIAGAGFLGYNSIALAIALGGTAGAMASAAVMIAGTLILNAVAPMMPDTPQLSGYNGNLADSRSYTWDGIVNDFRQGLVKPMVFGRIKVGGQIISEKTWYDRQNNEYLDTLVCPAVGRITRFIGIELNDTSVALYKNTVAVFRPGDDQQLQIDMFNKIYVGYSSAAKLPYNESTPVDVIQFTTKNSVSGIRLLISAPNGIYELDSSNNPSARSVPFKIEYKSTSSYTWDNLPIVDDSTSLPVIAFIYRSSGVFTGSSNPFTLTDAGANFDTNLSLGDEFELLVNGVIYYCTQFSTLTSDQIIFNAYTDEGRTTPLTSSIANGVYRLYKGSLISVYTGYVTVEAINWGWDYDISPFTAFSTIVNTNLISFDIVISSSTVTWARINLYAQNASGGEWFLWQSFEPGILPVYVYDEVHDVYTNTLVDTTPIGTVRFNYSTYLPVDWLSVRFALIVDNQVNGTLQINDIKIQNLNLDNSSPQGENSIAGLDNNPMHLVTKQIECLNLPEDYYDFRIWRTSADSTELTIQDDVYLKGYSEIIDRIIAYPNHALLGIRAMATDRLYGGRPKITSVCIAAPLTVPDASLCYNTTSANDLGPINVATLVNGVNVTGMRKVLINTVLSEPDDSYFWMVRMDSSGFADSSHLLTKYYLRVHTWEIIGSQTYIYLQDSEEIPNGTNLLLFNENVDPYVTRHTAWAVAKMLIEGSHGRIKENNIDWVAFAAWDAWNMELKNGKPRHLFDATIDFSADLWSIAMKAAQTARGNLLKKGNLYSVWVDKAKTHRQVFGEGNSSNVKVTPIPRADRANILITSFLDETNNYDQKDISIEDVQGSEFPITKTIPVQVGVVRESQIDDLLNFMLLQNRHISTTISLDTGIDSIEVEIGDTFIVASQAKDFSLSGRVTTINISIVILDQPFTPEEGETYLLRIWATDGTVYSWQGTLTGTDITEYAKPTGLPDSEHYEYPYVLCKLSEERMKYRCIGIKRAAETMFATLTGLEYRDECYIND